MTPGCVLPLPYADDVDAGAVDYPPVITDSNPDMPGPVSLSAPDIFTIDVDDQDIADTIYVRVFRADQAPSFLYDSKKASASNSTSTVRLLELPTNLWCAGAPLDVNLYFDIVVADRPFDSDPSATPPNRSVTAGGKSSVRSWVAVCPSTP